MGRRQGVLALVVFALSLVTIVAMPSGTRCKAGPLPPLPPGGLKTAFIHRAVPRGASLSRRLYGEAPQAPNNWADAASRFYNELVPWGDPNKGLQTIDAKKKAMVIKYMQKTGCSKEEAEVEVTAYLADKDGYIARKRAEEAQNKK